MEKSRKKKTLAKDYLKRALAAFTKVGASNEIARTKEELSGIRG